jgi:hypothetical protein
MIGNKIALLFAATIVVAADARALDALRPPLGLKTYRDLGLTVDETMLAREWREADANGKAVATLALGGWVFPLFDKENQIRLTLEAERTVWSSYSKDAGKSWSEPRFVGGLTETTIKGLEYRKASGKTLRLLLETSAGRKIGVSFREDDLCRLATAADLQHAPAGRFVLSSTPVANKADSLLADSLCVGRDVAFPREQPPKGYRIASELGLFVHESVTGQVVHRAQSKADTIYESRAVMTPRGDYIVFIPDGQHANAPRDNSNVLVAYRSSDQGATWNGPIEPFAEKAKHHACLPLVPKDGERIYLFETQRDPAVLPAKGIRAFGFRTSDDDGRQWSPVELILLDGKTTFGGTGVIQMTQTAAGSWMVGFHHSKMLRGAMENGQRRWSVVTPGKPAPKSLPELYFMDELRVLGLDNANVSAFARTCEGHLWQMRSTDDGGTWSQPQPTSLVQPDAPPMVFTLPNGSLIALHHNRAVLRSVHEPVHSDWLTMPSPTQDEIAYRNQHPHSLKDWVSRAEIWFSLSRDGAKTWSEPRLLFANALAETLDSANANYQCSYVDLFVDRGMIHLIVPHRWQRLVHLSFPIDKLGTFLTHDELASALPASRP